jgi:hypothetical protein
MVGNTDRKQAIVQSSRYSNEASQHLSAASCFQQRYYRIELAPIPRDGVRHCHRLHL